eukprot:TRINITY_DN505_c0_g1_i1.p1 TRINITY_DN505_c0_g1~~TRINITY_DN505_c0_g1_i1.p1  ORF type:complete len:206 (-),score=32.06 TRINITY_DN505_c0_g1_i1:73-603(-)
MSTNALTAGEWLESMNPFIFSGIGVGLAMAISASGAAWGIALVGSALVGHSVARPHVRTRNMVSIVFCEAVAIFGIISALLAEIKLSSFADPNGGVMPYETRFAGWAFFYGGLVVGLCNLCCGVSVGITGSAVVTADASNPDIFVKVLVIEVFASVLGIFGLIVGILLVSGPVKVG